MSGKSVTLAQDLLGCMQRVFRLFGSRTASGSWSIFEGKQRTVAKVAEG